MQKLLLFAEKVLDKKINNSTTNGVLESLAYLYHLSDNWKDNIFAFAKNIIESFNLSDDFTEVSGALLKFCDIVPDLVLSKLENEFSAKPKKIASFYTDYNYDLFYILEKLIQISKTSERAIILAANLYFQNDKFGSLLTNIFCPWFNFLPLSTRYKKGEMANELICVNESFWEIIEKHLPARTGSVFGGWSEPLFCEEQIEIRLNLANIGK